MHKYILILLLSVLTLYADCMQYSSDIDIGTCYESEGNQNLAQAAYERALIEDENNLDAQLKLANLYSIRGMKKEANALIRNISKAQLTPAQQTSLAAIQTSQLHSLNTLNIRANLYLGYDTNVNITPADTILIDANTSSEKEQKSIFTRTKADLSYLHDLGSAGGWFLRSDVNFYYQNNASAHYYDVAYARIYAGGGYRTGNFTLYIPLFYDRISYLDRDLFQEYGMRPDLTVRLISTLFLNLNANYNQRRYIQNIDISRNDDMLSGGIGLFWLRSSSMFYGKFRYESYNAIDDVPAPFTDNTQLYLKVGGIYSLGDLADLELDYQYRHGDYTKVVDLKRDDTNHDFNFNVMHNITQSFRINANYRYVKNDSTYDLAQYVKQEFMLGLEYNY